jgi:outer membrane cobalamin receptor
MKRTTLWIAILAAFTSGSHAAGDSLDELSLEDLVKTDITSVARKSQSLADVPAAAFVITAEDIRRSGARALPDVLRMAPGIQVAQIDNGRYAVTARSFNGRFATKLQVLVDGRSLYHSLFGGVMWELDPIPLEDIERIEIIRGAGAVMWGANAVNGVINIISKHTRNQTGTAVTVIRRHQGHRRLLCPHWPIRQRQLELETVGPGTTHRTLAAICEFRRQRGPPRQRRHRLSPRPRPGRRPRPERLGQCQPLEYHRTMEYPT